MSEKKIDLIAQLLAKAESTTPEEAEALNWYGIACSALTAIRREWSLLRVLATYEDGYETPVSGDDLHKA